MFIWSACFMHGCVCAHTQCYGCKSWNIFSAKLRGGRPSRHGDSWDWDKPRIRLWGAGLLWRTVGLTKGRAACHILIQGIHRHLCVFTVHKTCGHSHASSRTWFKLEILHESHARTLNSCAHGHMYTFQSHLSILCNEHSHRHVFRCVATPVPHLNPLTDIPGALRLLGGLRRTPANTHNTGRIENITSSFKPVPLLISAAQRPPLPYLPFCLLMLSSSFFSFALHHFNFPPALLSFLVPYLPLFFINFWLSLDSIPGGVVWNVRHFWETAKQMQTPRVCPTTWTSSPFHTTEP